MAVQVTASVAETREAVRHARAAGRSVGFVPTMGALHAGHASLIQTARSEADFVAVSIFVNPTQFGPGEDLDRYPRTLEQDLQLCAAAGAGLVFTPTPAVMYPPGFCTYVEVHDLQGVLEGKTRPTHFRGVATVVLKLLNIVAPDAAYFGQKDAQQARILQQLIRDLDVPVRMRICPTVREADGLAMSSRNRYLDQNHRRQAPVLYQALEEARRSIDGGERDPAAVERLLRDRIGTAPDARVDYAGVVSFDTLAPPPRIGGRVLVAVAVYFGQTRLIDNVLVDVA